MSTITTLRVDVPDEQYHRELIACQVACPVQTDARGYIRAIAAGRWDEAYLIARGPNPLASICGRVCGAPCEAACRRGKVPRVDADGHFVAHDRPLAIRALKRFACERWELDGDAHAEALLERLPGGSRQVLTDSAGPEEFAALLQNQVSGRFEPANGEPIAVIGAGPAGLAAAHDLALMGLRPVVFESERTAAGMLAYGVPAYRLPRALIAREVAVIEALGVEIRCGLTVGQDISLAQLRRDFAAVIIAIGAQKSRGLALPGEAGPRVYGGVDLLRAVSRGESLDIGRDVVVIGGGNVAYDVARTVVRQIAIDTARTAARLPGTGRVVLTSLESLEEMPADTLEILEGDEEGIERLNGWGPVEIERGSGGEVRGVVFRRCERVYDEQRRFAPMFQDHERRTIPCDTVFLAVGQGTDLTLLADGGQDIAQSRPGWLTVDADTLATTAPGVFVAGDLAHGTRLLIDAVASGKRAARSVFSHVTGRSLTAEALTAHLVLPRYERELGYEAIRRVAVPTLPPAERLTAIEMEVERGYGPAEAMREASRCLDCGVTPVFDAGRCVLCGGCVDVCPTQCLTIVPLTRVTGTESWQSLLERTLGAQPDLEGNSVILKDEDRCIRCALCAMRCPTDAITMERVTCSTRWRTQ